MKAVLLLCVLFSTSGWAQKTDAFFRVRKTYENRQTEDEGALPQVYKALHLAKKENNIRHLIQAYKDAVQYSRPPKVKMAYADSALVCAQRTKDPALLADAYLGKGIIYYFTMKKFRPALDQYVEAQKYAEQAGDEYVLNKIRYHIGVVKIYLGEEKDAVTHFETAAAYFEKQMRTQKNEIIVSNNRRAWLNTLRQLAVVTAQLKQFKRSDSLVTLGLNQTRGDEKLLLENAYFMKCRGMSEFREQNDNAALWYLKKSVPELQKRNDFSTLSLIYLYLGKLYLRNADSGKASLNFRKVDSVYQKNGFIMPEAREAYKFLITMAAEKRDTRQELIYNRQLVSVDEFLREDFQHVYSKMYLGHERAKFLKSQETLKRSEKMRNAVILYLGILLLSGLLYFWRYRKKRLDIIRKYSALQLKMQKKSEETPQQEIAAVGKKRELPEEIAAHIEKQLKRFEEKKGFTAKGLRVADLAKKLGTNEKYLALYMKERKGMQVTRYINELRINYILMLFENDSRYLKYTVDVLADEAGFRYRQHFSTTFVSVTGIPPADYIRLKTKENKNR